MKSFVWLIVLGCVAFACLEEPDCVNTVNNLVGVTFKSLKDGKVAPQTFSRIGLGTDTAAIVPFEADSITSKIFLPVDYFDDTTTYTLVIQDTVYHLVFKYISQPQFVSDDCGERYALKDLELIEYSFDSIRVVSSSPGVDKNANNFDIIR